MSMNYSESKWAEEQEEEADPDKLLLFSVCLL